MLGPHWFFRMKRWVQNPPPMGRVALVLGVVAACILLVAAERAGLLPDWMAAQRAGRGGVFRP